MPMTAIAMASWTMSGWQAAPALLAQHPALAEKHVARWLGGKAEFLKA
mgnify:CR=1 FL=1